MFCSSNPTIVVRGWLIRQRGFAGDCELGPRAGSFGQARACALLTSSDPNFYRARHDAVLAGFINDAQVPILKCKRHGLPPPALQMHALEPLQGAERGAGNSAMSEV